MNKSSHKVIILGTGPAGLTAGVYTARAAFSPLIIEGPLPGGQLTTTTDVENFPGFSDGIMGPRLMDEMRKQCERFGAKVETGWVEKIDFTNPHEIKLYTSNTEYTCEALIISTGATAKTLGLSKDASMMGYGVSTCATCDGAFFKDQEIVVVGGGDSACEEAHYLTKFGKRVRLILRRDEFRASKIMVDRVLKTPKIEVIYNTTVVDLIGDQNSGLTGIVVENVKTKERSELETAALFYAIGHTPNTGIFKGVLDMDENGYLVTKPDSTVTNVEGVFACGDVRDHVYRQAITAAGNGCMAAIEVERYLAGKE